VVLANAFADLGSWIAAVFERIGDIPVSWLLLALGLKTAESAFIGLAWRNILRAAYPRSGLSFKTSWGSVTGRDRYQRDCAGPGRDGRHDRHLPHEHSRLVGRGHHIRDHRAGALSPWRAS
jgi:hypothetical protein